VIFFTTTLVISIVGLISLITLKRWEMKTGRILSVAARPKVTQGLTQASVWMEHHAPAFVRHLAARALRFIEVQIHRAVAYGVLVFERLLESTLEVVRYKTQVKHTDATASAFLREVSAHKKVIQQMSAEERTYEE